MSKRKPQTDQEAQLDCVHCHVSSPNQPFTAEELAWVEAETERLVEQPGPYPISPELTREMLLHRLAFQSAHNLLCCGVEILHRNGITTPWDGTYDTNSPTPNSPSRTNTAPTAAHEGDAGDVRGNARPEVRGVHTLEVPKVRKHIFQV